jgi:hypothetical protein
MIAGALLLLTAATASNALQFSVTSTNVELFYNDILYSYGSNDQGIGFPLMTTLLPDDAIVYRFHDPLLSIPGNASSTVAVTFEFDTWRYQPWSAMDERYITLICEILRISEIQTSLSTGYATFNTPEIANIDGTYTDENGTIGVPFEMDTDVPYNVTQGVAVVLRAYVDNWNDITPIAIPPTATFTFSYTADQYAASYDTRGPFSPTNVYDYYNPDPTTINWIPPLMPFTPQQAGIFTVPLLAGPTADVMWINIDLTHNITVDGTDQRTAAVVHVLMDQETAACAFPLDEPTCACRALVPIVLNERVFSMNATVVCDQAGTFNGNITLTQVSEDGDGNWMAFISHFPLPQAINTSSISISLHTTNFVPASTAPTASTSTPTAVPEFEAAKLGGRGTRVALFTTVAAAAAVSATLVGLAVRFLK